MKGEPGRDHREREIPTPKLDPAMRETDDHTMGQAPRGDAQPIDGLDRGVADEHVKSPAQGVRPEPEAIRPER
jgi:hypothetical protein